MGGAVDRAPLRRFLDSTAMGADVVTADGQGRVPSVAISTMHAAKGLDPASVCASCVCSRLTPAWQDWNGRSSL
jgi:superfamily I DNA/RNA helicase